ncbi:MAG: hypothetical protein OEV42_18710 [Deltaproteobacteria bacterium]|nr:hypothetical protein [Deltaproteobacteria bacterium]
MVLKPQDIIVVLKIVAMGKEKSRAWSYASLALQVGMSPAEVHAGIKRLISAKLLVRIDEQFLPATQALLEFLCHGIAYVFIPDLGELTRGLPTGFSAPPLSGIITQGEELPYVWPDAEGEVRGVSFSPLYKSVPYAARNDRALYELLVLVDGIRGGRAREREIAVKELEKRLKEV